MKQVFCKRTIGLASLCMVVIMGCTACASEKYKTTDKIDINQTNQTVEYENETEDMQENQQIGEQTNLADANNSDSNFYEGADLQGSVVEFSESGFELSAAEVIKEEDGMVMAEAAPGSENKEDLISITYASDVTFEIVTMDKASLTEICREETDRQGIKKQTSVLVFGSCQDTYHWTADKVIIMRWK